jgi:hypothetical protein
MTESNKRPLAIEALFREAVKCRACFDHGAITAPTIDIAQPRWIGEGYWASSPRVCVVMLNPGAGADHNVAANRRMQILLQLFRSGETGLDDVFRFQRGDFPTWGKPPGRFLNFFRTFGLDIDRIALANVAWCATTNNHYPRWMLDACMRRFTGRLMDLLKPDVVMLSGSSLHAYGIDVKHLAPNARTFRTLHYAHRKSQEEESREAWKFHELLASFFLTIRCHRLTTPLRASSQ